MGIQIISGATSDLQTVDPTTKAARVAIYPPSAVGGGRYRLGASSGLFTTIAARTATAGHLFAWRWTSGTVFAKVLRINLSVRTVAGFTAAQEFSVGLWRLSGYSASHSGATTLTLTSPEFKKDTTDATSALGYAGIATAAALTAGTHTFAANPIAMDAYAELAAGAAVPKGRMDLGFNMNEVVNEPLVFRQNEGLVVTNEILMGAAGTARLYVAMDWIETTAI